MRHAGRSSAVTAVSARRRLLKLVALIAVAFVVAALALPHSPHVLQQAVPKAGVAAPIVFALAWAGLTPPLCSGTVFARAAGLAFGMPLGSLTGIVGATLERLPPSSSRVGSRPTRYASSGARGSDASRTDSSGEACPR
jgi:hypothetical protein